MMRDEILRQKTKDDNNESVCITGATGFLGGYLVKLMEAKGYRVVAFARNESKGMKLLSPQTSFVKGDLAKMKDVDRAIKGCDYVIHAGALSSAWGVWEDFYYANVIGTQNVLRSCRKYGVKRLVYISSPSIYTRDGDQYEISESQVEWNSELNYYIKTKIMAEKLVSEWRSHYTERVIIRPRGLFGIGDTSVIPRLLKVNSKVGLPLFRGGKNLMDITYVENVAHSIWLALSVADIDGGIYNITNGEPMAFKKLLKLFLKHIGEEPKFLRLKYKPLFKVVSAVEKMYLALGIKKEPMFTKYTLMTLGFTQTMSIEAARDDLGYEPIYTIEEGVKIYAKWYKEHQTD